MPEEERGPDPALPGERAWGRKEPAGTLAPCQQKQRFWGGNPGPRPAWARPQGHGSLEPGGCTAGVARGGGMVGWPSCASSGAPDPSLLGWRFLGAGGCRRRCGQPQGPGFGVLHPVVHSPAGAGETCPGLGAFLPTRPQKHSNSSSVRAADPALTAWHPEDPAGFPVAVSGHRSRCSCPVPQFPLSLAELPPSEFMQVADSTWLVLSVVSNGRAPSGCQATGVTKIARSVIAPLAEHHVSVLMLSTYQTDFVLVSPGVGTRLVPRGPGSSVVAGGDPAVPSWLRGR